jgi:hypothetical protein
MLDRRYTLFQQPIHFVIHTYIYIYIYIRICIDMYFIKRKI